MIPGDILVKMIEDGAFILRGESEDSPLIVNFWVIKQKYPQYLDFLVETNLNAVELSFLRSGFIDYSVRQDGLLEWHVTPYGRKFGG